MNIQQLPIGFMDSGVGGISVLREAVKLLPNEKFIYYGDSQNAPYGIKTDVQIRKLTFNAVEVLRQKPVKAIVIACNTATSVAINDLRTRYQDMPIIGIEPAVKPAIKISHNQKILIMATPMTLKREKFFNLVERYADAEQVLPLACPGLVELIEQGQINGAKVQKFLSDLLKPYLQERISVVVLGCTHYPFIKKALQEILPKTTAVIDGSLGTVNQLRNQLQEKNLLNNSESQGTVEIINSKADERLIILSKKLLAMK